MPIYEVTYSASSEAGPPREAAEQAAADLVEEAGHSVYGVEWTDDHGSTIEVTVDLEADEEDDPETFRRTEPAPNPLAGLLRA
ncbi:hypothetical protein ACFVAJ_18455 [Agromyces sp. NPDC057679]|uniref:hypothetical protein n=1 Tax=Agromyces sp. NPDC057679 TaxID=3346207 RepID=UPI00367273CC